MKAQSSQVRPYRSSKFPSNRRGLTLVEMLVAMVLTLMLVFALVTIFAWVGDATTKGRAMMELQGKMRNVLMLLQQDLDGVTCLAMPNGGDTSGEGYIELVEGPSSDKVEYIDYNAAAAADRQRDLLPAYSASGGSPTASQHSYRGDHDDIICATCRANDAPFTTNFNGETLSSDLAEVVWWTQQINGADSSDPKNLRCNVYRRALLIRPDLRFSHSGSNGPTYKVWARRYSTLSAVEDFQLQYDISVRLDPADSDNVIANSLADLSDRQNRVAHRWPSSAGSFVFPYESIADPVNSGKKKLWLPEGLKRIVLRDERLGEDLVASDCLALDMKVWDPKAAVWGAVPGSDTGETPDDPGYLAAAPPNTTWTPDPILTARYNLQNTYHFGRHPLDDGTLFGGPYFIGYGGFGVKFIYANNGTGAGYYINSAGQVYLGNGSSTTLGGTLVATLDPAVFADPMLLINAQPQNPPPSGVAGAVGFGAWVNMGYDRSVQTVASTTTSTTTTPPDQYAAQRALWNLQNTYHFARHTLDDGTLFGGPYFIGYGGFGVKFIYANNGTGAGYYINSAGQLYLGNGSSTTLGGTLVATVGANVFSDPTVLLNVTQPPPPPAPITTTTTTPGDLKTVSWFSNYPMDLATNATAMPANKSQFLFPIYDTWNRRYNHDGSDQTGAALSNSPYRYGEDDTTAPYSFPLRGVKVTVRLYETGTRQVLQYSMVSRLLP